MADRPDLDAIRARLDACPLWRQEHEDVSALLGWVDALEMQARIRAEQEQERSRAMMVAYAKGR